MNYYLHGATVLAVALSCIISPEKTLAAITVAYKKCTAVLPPLGIMLILVSVVLFFVPDTIIARYLGTENRFSGVLLASLLGSLSLMPGFIAFPLCGILLKKGVAYMVLSAFSTTLMMVGILTYPLEKQYFGAKVTLLRNAVSLLIALLVAFMTGIFFGEIVP